MVYQNPILALQRFVEHFERRQGGPPRRSPGPSEGAPVSVFDALPLGDSGRDPGLLLVEHHVPEAQVARVHAAPLSPPPSAGARFKRVPTSCSRKRREAVEHLRTQAVQPRNLSRSALDTVGLMQLLIVTVLVPGLIITRYALDRSAALGYVSENMVQVSHSCVL
ncbi:hypothetical protein Q5P01_000698 [Channa striata]|uniref:Uncharacterized protein n=1 Tax=Channa striata TaxID=64152 RepID=A0AA88IJV8_CHASR|nr:hypothetical protein Q5P01_000698 [Channa striata]